MYIYNTCCIYALYNGVARIKGQSNKTFIKSYLKNKTEFDTCNPAEYEFLGMGFNWY